MPVLVLQYYRSTHVSYPSDIPPATPNPALTHWNALSPEAAAAVILPCCGSETWAQTLATHRPILDEPTLIELSNQIWQALPKPAQQQAFDSHPRLGEHQAKAATAQAAKWSIQEQSLAEPTEALREANARYEAKFGRIFLLCANGRTTSGILAALEARLGNDPETEWQEAVEQQRQITQRRLERWLESHP